MKNTEKKIVLITGANRGLGYEIARQLGEKDMVVILGARNADAGKAAVSQLSTQNIEVHFVQLDILQQESIRNAAALVEEQFGRLDILVNNAARLPNRKEAESQKFLPSDISAELLYGYINTNFMAQVAVTQAFLPLIKKSQAGRIVNMSSSIGSVTIASEHLHENGPKPPFLAYAASKAALNMFTVQLAKELAGTSIKVNSADPGLTQTDAGGPTAPNTVAQGAKPAVWLACLDADGPTGCFFTHRLEHTATNPW
ncbi:SDR family oxidoreductase [Pedobacter sp. L105]|uniref:SDR family oxidoreductase n=1 Tax=Pedobacter sp. L105 TaxID=1641871 RepID=UPI00131C8AE1|nr:SDR family oxidoreductase [Pedobacter sp. L105]